ncbi:hypothetical protein [Parvibaculum sp.]|uniref:hypothetical protein n=1 Tax=Parvibaculum sp. TaxID=2024848 RepID=UPI001B2134DB|nr:hypothetical protein [Parvibaculum sp.]MBO6668014.1 hypothetical protein [Parvibaculum sp.]MBO6693338.1 hypothetical protein [Parvibaculum sp.]MBO6714750.1 hypothetical protein [Parvibaculum sp.]
MFTYWLAVVVGDDPKAVDRLMAFDEAFEKANEREIFGLSSSFVVFESAEAIDTLCAALGDALDPSRDSFLLHRAGRDEARAFGLPVQHELF